MTGRAVLGVVDRSGRDDTGRAVLVVVGLDTAGDVPAVLSRRDVDLCGAGLPRRVLHAAWQVPAEEADDLVAAAARAARARASDALGEVVAGARATGHRIATAAVPVDHGRDDVLDGDLAEILASHALVHAAEQALYRAALVQAAEEQGVAVVRYAPGALAPVAASATGRSVEAVDEVVAGWGRVVGRPWRREHKEAATAAWLALLG